MAAVYHGAGGNAMARSGAAASPLTFRPTRSPFGRIDAWGMPGERYAYSCLPPEAARRRDRAGWGAGAGSGKAAGLAQCAARLSAGQWQQQLEGAAGAGAAPGGTAPGALPLRAGRTRQVHADGPLLRDRIGRSQAAGPLPRLDVRGAREAAPLARRDARFEGRSSSGPGGRAGGRGLAALLR